VLPKSPTFDQVSEQFALSDRTIQRKWGASLSENHRWHQKRTLWLLSWRVYKDSRHCIYTGFRRIKCLFACCKRWQNQ